MASAKVVAGGLAEIGVSTGGRPDDLAEKNGCSISLRGDSYALGIAGTGGTSSLFPVLGGSNWALGVGSLEDEVPAGKSGNPPELRAEPKLVLDDRDCPELYDLRLGSGVVLEDEGVTLFLWRGPGDRSNDPDLVRVGSG